MAKYKNIKNYIVYVIINNQRYSILPGRTIEGPSSLGNIEGLQLVDDQISTIILPESTISPVIGENFIKVYDENEFKGWAYSLNFVGANISAVGTDRITVYVDNAGNESVNLNDYSLKSEVNSISSSLDARLDTLENQTIYNVKNYGAIGDGVTDDTAAIQSVLDIGTPDEPITVYFPPGTYRVWNLFLGKGVHIIGSKASVLKLLENPEGNRHPFYSGGVRRETYHKRKLYTVDNIVAGNTVTLTSPAEAAQFPVGTYILVQSDAELTVSATDRQPYFALINKVISSNTTTGVLTLQSPILDDIGAAKIGKENDWLPGESDADERWCCESSIDGITIDADTSEQGAFPSQGIYIQALYACSIRNVDIVNASTGIALNGQCYSEWSNITWLDMRTVNLTHNRFIEIKTASYLSVFRDLVFYKIGSALNSSNVPVEMGEYANRCVATKMRIYAPGQEYNAPFAIGFSSTPGVYCEFSDIYMQCAGSRAAVSTNQNNPSGRLDSIGIVIKNVIFDCKACALLVRVTPGQSSRNEYRIENIRGIHPPALPAFYVGTTAAMNITELNNMNGIIIRNIESDGEFKWQPGSLISAYTNPALSIRDCTFRTVSIANVDPESRAQPWQIDVGRLRRTYKPWRSSIVDRRGSQQTIVYTDGSEITLFDTTFSVSDAEAWCQSDKIDLFVDGSLNGVVGNKTIRLYIDDVVVITLTTASVHRFELRGSVGLFGSPTKGSITGNFWGVLGAAISSYRHQVASVSSISFKVTAQVASSGDEIRFYRREVVPVLAMED